MIMAFDAKKIRKSDLYKYVELHQIGEKQMWKGAASRTKNGKYFDTEREAAVYVDKQLIEQDKEPVNILIRK